MRGAKKQAPRWWFPLLGAGFSAIVVLLALLLAETSGLTPPVGREASISPLWRGSDGRALHLAGTGTWLPLARSLERAYEARSPEVDVVVHESIGSRGGLEALRDGVVDLGLVSWPASHLRREACCTATEVALAAVVFTVNPSVVDPSITSAQLVEIYSGRMSRWSDGQVVVPLLREPGDSSTAVAGEAIPGLADAMDDERARGRWPALLSDAEMGRALRAIPGAVGLYDLGALLLEDTTLRPLILDGVPPNAQTLANGRYPLRRTLSLVAARSPREAVRRFLSFVASEEGREVVARSGGYLPLSEGSR